MYLRYMITKSSYRYRGLTRAKATWAKRQDLIDDGFGPFIDNYDDNYNDARA